jgi:hypothetical protein
MSNSHTKYYLSTSAGSGKTRATVAMMLSDENTLRNFVVVSPTIALTMQTFGDIKQELGTTERDVRPIVSDQASEDRRPVATQAREVLEEMNHSNGIILLLCVPTFLSAAATVPVGQVNASIVLDETFQPFQFNTFNLGDENHRQTNLEYFSELFSLSPNGGPLMIQDGKETLVDAVARGDEVDFGGRYSALKPIAAMVNDPATHCDLVSNYTKLMNNELQTIQVASTISPKAFNKFPKVTIMSALFEETALYIVWRKTYGVTFEADTEIAQYINRDPHTSWGNKVHIGYILHPEDSVSVSLWKRDYQTGERDGEAAGTVIQEAFNQLAPLVSRWPDKTLIHTNNAHAAMAERTFDKDKAVSIPADARGFNDHKGVHNIISTGVTHPNQSQAVWLQRTLGIPSEAVYRMFRIHTTYQAINRTSLRDSESSANKLLIVGDKATHDWLLTLYKDSCSIGQVTKLHQMAGRKPRKAKVERLSDRDGYTEKREGVKVAKRRLARAQASGDTHKIEGARTQLKEVEDRYQYWRSFG